MFVHPVVDCKSCGTSLEFVEVLKLRCSQVHELPPITTAQADGKASLSFTQLADFEHRYQELIEAGLILNPPPLIDLDLPNLKGRRKQTPPKNLLDRLQLHQSAVLLFMHNWRVPFNNNAELGRTGSPIGDKLRRKSSCQAGLSGWLKKE